MPPPPASATPTAPPVPKAVDRTPSPRSPKAADSRQWLPPSPDQAVSKLAIGPWPTSSRVAVVAPILASPSTSTSRRASDAGRAGPAACHVPPPDAKIPTVPGRVHAPASNGVPDALNAAAVSWDSPHARPAGDTATERSLARLAQAARVRAATSTSPRRGHASRAPAGAPPSAAREAGERGGG